MDDIGQFQIGIGSIGTPPFNWEQTVYSQYAQSQIINQLLSDVSAWIDPNQSVDSFYDQLWNITTATGYGLDVWGRIVGVNRVLSLVPKYFGFEEAGTLGADPFGQSAFYSGPVLSSSYPLSDNAFRTLILAKAAANITNCSIPAINAIMRFLFGSSGACYCTDGLNLTMTYTFYFTLSQVQLSIIQTAGVLPRPAGVSYTIVQI
jgi:hypothetical protein